MFNAVRIAGENSVSRRDAVANAWSMTSIAGMTAATLGEALEKKRVPSWMIWREARVNDRRGVQRRRMKGSDEGRTERMS